ncbi:MAG: DNA-processing protein DprA [Lachnospiraceae bacterium]|nr:DNA-processing protein DprA [Lachnospiraceae bacterium]
MENRGRSAGEQLRYIRKQDPEYPEKLSFYDRMPAGLYVKGNLPDPEKKTVAMVGARNCSSYGRTQALQFAEQLAREGVQIISGLAYGIDAYSHQGALKGGGKTFAVLGCGADICYPKENYLIYEEILKTGGGILSEYEPGTPPLGWHFPIRNRVISALADLVLVVEARKKSGSLITVEYALEQGKSIFAVPGRVGDSCSQGCNSLIAQGAGIAWNPEVVLEELFGSWKERSGEAKQSGESFLLRFSEEERAVLRVLQTTELSLERISAESHLELRTAATVLTMLSLEGVVYCPSPGYYCRSEDWPSEEL